MSYRTYIFRDRHDAGRKLARELLTFKPLDPVIMALPRGGVPVAYEIAKRLDAPLDLLMVRKIGAPGHKELGIGAIADGDDPQILVNEEAAHLVIPPGYFEEEARAQLKQIEVLRRKYLAGRPPQPVGGRAVIAVDDGIATGGTVRIALRALRRARAARIILAVPVAPADVLEALRTEADEFVCLSTPESFFAVGRHYAHFDQISDDEVVRLLDDIRKITI